MKQVSVRSQIVSGVRHISQVDHNIGRIMFKTFVSGVRHISQVDHGQDKS